LAKKNTSIAIPVWQKTLELNTKKGSLVMAKIAGTLSMAKQHPLLHYQCNK
jgi:hypothetical protein